MVCVVLCGVQSWAQAAAGSGLMVLCILRFVLGGCVCVGDISVSRRLYGIFAHLY